MSNQWTKVEHKLPEPGVWCLLRFKCEDFGDRVQFGTYREKGKHHDKIGFYDDGDCCNYSELFEEQPYMWMDVEDLLKD